MTTIAYDRIHLAVDDRRTYGSRPIKGIKMMKVTDHQIMNLENTIQFEAVEAHRQECQTSNKREVYVFSVAGTAGRSRVIIDYTFPTSTKQDHYRLIVTDQQSSIYISELKCDLIEFTPTETDVEFALALVHLLGNALGSIDTKQETNTIKIL